MKVMGSSSDQMFEAEVEIANTELSKALDNYLRRYSPLGGGADSYAISATVGSVETDGIIAAIGHHDPGWRIMVSVNVRPGIDTYHVYVIAEFKAGEWVGVDGYMIATDTEHERAWDDFHEGSFAAEPSSDD